MDPIGPLGLDGSEEQNEGSHEPPKYAHQWAFPPNTPPEKLGKTR